MEEEYGKPEADRKAHAYELFSEELNLAERSYQDILDDLRSHDTTFSARNLRPLSIPDLQTKLNSDTAVVEYILLDDGLAIFVLTHESLRAQTVPVSTAHLVYQMSCFETFFLRRDTNDWQKPAEGLYRVLFKPIEETGWLKGISRLYIVPHGILNHLPFVALLRSPGFPPHFLMQDSVLALCRLLRHYKQTGFESMSVDY